MRERQFIAAITQVVSGTNVFHGCSATLNEINMGNKVERANFLLNERKNAIVGKLMWHKQIKTPQDVLVSGNSQLL